MEGRRGVLMLQRVSSEKREVRVRGVLMLQRVSSEKGEVRVRGGVARVVSGEDASLGEAPLWREREKRRLGEETGREVSQVQVPAGRARTGLGRRTHRIPRVCAVWELLESERAILKREEQSVKTKGRKFPLSCRPSRKGPVRLSTLAPLSAAF